MASKNLESNRRDVGSYRDRKRAQGLVKKEAWIKPENFDRFNAFIKELNKESCDKEA